LTAVAAQITFEVIVSDPDLRVMPPSLGADEADHKVTMTIHADTAQRDVEAASRSPTADRQNFCARVARKSENRTIVERGQERNEQLATSRVVSAAR